MFAATNTASGPMFLIRRIAAGAGIDCVGWLAPLFMAAETDIPIRFPVGAAIVSLASKAANLVTGAHYEVTEVTAPGTSERPSQPRSPAFNSYLELMPMDENRFASLLGHAALKVWPDLPREAQEQLFAASVDDGVIANSLAVFLHDRHPKTAHPPKPTRIA